MCLYVFFSFGKEEISAVVGRLNLKDAGITDYYTSTYCPFIIALEKVMVSCLIELLQSVY